MNLTMMLFLHDFSLSFDDPDDENVVAGPSTPRPADPAPEGADGEPVGDDDGDGPEDPDPPSAGDIGDVD